MTRVPALDALLAGTLLAISGCDGKERASAVTADVTAETNSVIAPDPARVEALAELLRTAESPHRVTTMRAIGDHAVHGDRAAFEAVARVLLETEEGERRWPQDCPRRVLADELVRQVSASNPAVDAAFAWMVAHREHPSYFVREKAWRGIAAGLRVPALREAAMSHLDEAAARDEMYLVSVLFDGARESHAGALESLVRMEEFFEVAAIARTEQPLAGRAREAIELAWKSDAAETRVRVVRGVVNHAAWRDRWPVAQRIVEEARADPDVRVRVVVSQNERWLEGPPSRPLDPVAWLRETARRAMEALSPHARVKKNLKDLFLAERSFFGEYGTYTTDLEIVVFAPSSDEYAYGFCSAYPADSEIPGICDVDTNRNVAPGGGLANPCAALALAGSTARFEADGQSFTAFAARNRDADPDLEVWSIDENRTVQRLSKD